MAEATKQVDSSHYAFLRYVDERRWASLWCQLEQIFECRPSRVLEVGKGAGLLGLLLQHYGVRCCTVDIDPELGPDSVASVTNLPFQDSSFDVVVCFQVLEHLHYDFFEQGLSELARVAREHVIVSLPDAQVLWQYSFYVPKVGRRTIFVPRPRLRPRRHAFDGEHYWEIGVRGYPLSRICASMERVGLSMSRTFRPEGNTYHRFFCLAKREGG